MQSTASARFYQYGARLLFMLVVAAMLCCTLLAGYSLVARAMPYSVKVEEDAVDDVNDPHQDDYPSRAAAAGAAGDDGLEPGGAEIGRGIDDMLRRHDAYNAAVNKLAASTFGAPMKQAAVTRASLFEADDDWTTERVPDAAPLPMTREITLFNF